MARHWLGVVDLRRSRDRLRTDPHVNLGWAMGPVEQAQRRRVEPQLVQQLAQRLSIPQEPAEELQRAPNRFAKLSIIYC